jgi:flagellar motor switch protein FliM
MLPPDERVLVLRFHVKLNQSEGGLNVLLPIGTAAAMVRKLSTMAIAPARNGAPTASQKIQERLLDCVCSMELSVRGIKVAVQDVLSLRPGKLLDLGIPISAPAVVSLEGYEWFEASPVRAGAFRAAKLTSPIKKRLGNG